VGFYQTLPGMKGIRLWIVLTLAWINSGCAGTPTVTQVLPEATQPVELTATLPVTPTGVPEIVTPTTTATQPPEPTTTFTPTSTPIPFIYDYGPGDFPAGINPLTGLQADPLANLERRPIVIKVTNFPRSVRPQWGLSLADHVYEYYIGDDMSRFVGVFYGNDASRVGPIRSARLFDVHVTRMYRGLFVFGWADDAVLNFLFAPDLKPHLIVENETNCPPLCRIGPKTAYNTLFADTTQISAYLTRRRTNNDRQNLDGMRFALATPLSGNPGENIAIQYSLVSYHRWEYDRQKGRYFRFQETGPHIGNEGQYAPLVDSLTDTQLSANNVIVLLTPHQFFKKSASTEIIDQPFMGYGIGYAFRDGQIFPLTWKRDATDHLPELSLPDGSLYPLKPGNTWFEMLGEASHYEQLEHGSWYFEFSMP
jgi:hypothetical protein